MIDAALGHGRRLGEKYARRLYCKLTCHRFDRVSHGHLICRQCDWELVRTSS